MSPKFSGAAGCIAVAAGAALVFFGPQRRDDLLARTVVMTATSDSIDGGNSRSQLLPDPRGAACVWKLRPGFRYPWAGMRFRFVRSPGDTLDLSWSQAIRIRMEAAPASNIRLQVLSLDRSHGPRAIAHARELNVGAGLDTSIAWEEFRIPAWFQDSADPAGDQRLELLAKATSIDLQSAYVGPGHDSTTLRVLALEAVGPARGWRIVGLGLLIIGISTLVILGFALVRSAISRFRSERLGALLHGRKSVQLDSSRLRIRDEIQIALREHFADPDLSLESLARHVNLSPRAISSLLKESTGLNFKPALNELRLAEAGRLLLESSGSVAEIGYAVGFRNSSHFGRAFREKHGVSPSKWRENGPAQIVKGSTKPASAESAESR